MGSSKVGRVRNASRNARRSIECKLETIHQSKVKEERLTVLTSFGSMRTGGSTGSRRRLGTMAEGLQATWVVLVKSCKHNKMAIDPVLRT